MNKTFSQICLVVTFIGMSVAYSTSAVAQTLASGSLSCTVEQIDPPSGVPWAGATLYFSDVLGIIGGPIENYVDIGTGSGLEANCQELAETMSRVAQNQSCTVSAIQNTQEQGGNYIFNRWKFDLVCDGKQSTVVNAISSLLKELLTTPLASSQTILKKSNEMRDNSAN
jgi:hypothetical protein